MFSIVFRGQIIDTYVILFDKYINSFMMPKLKLSWKTPLSSNCRISHKNRHTKSRLKVFLSYHSFSNTVKQWEIGEWRGKNVRTGQAYCSTFLVFSLNSQALAVQGSPQANVVSLSLIHFTPFFFQESAIIWTHALG